MVKNLRKLCLWAALLTSGTLTAQNYNVNLVQCANTTNGSTVFQFTNLGVPSGDGTLDLNQFWGDFSAAGEFFQLFDENNNQIGGNLSSNTDCSSTGSANFIIPLADLIAWGADGVIEFTATAQNATTSVNNFCMCSGPGSAGGTSAFVVDMTLDYPVVTGANDIGVASLDSPNIFCAGPHNIVTTIRNFGINQVDTFTVNWSLNGMLQTPVVVNNVLLDTIGGAGSNDHQLTLGSVNFTGPNVVSIWTSNPNNMNDTVNANDTTTVPLQPSLQGTYTIGTGMGVDYTTFQDAMDDLAVFGVCAPVVFNVQDGNYLEQFESYDVPGSSDINTITFQSLNGDSSLVVVEWDQSNTTTNNHVMRMAGGEHYRFKDMTFANTSPNFSYRMVVNVANSINDVTFERMAFMGGASTTPSTFRALVYKNNVATDHVVFDNCRFEGGSYGVYWRGSSSDYDESNKMINCDIVRPYYMGSYWWYQNDTEVMGNEVFSNSTYTSGYGLYAYYWTGVNKMNNNFVYSEQGSRWPRYGIYMFSVQGDLNDYAEIYNNRILIALDPGYTTSYNGIYSSNCVFNEYVHNTVFVGNGNTAAESFFLTGGSFNFLYNNLVIMDGQGYSMYVSGSGLYDSDNNAFYSNNSSSWAFFNGAQADLAAWQAASGEDANSVEVTNTLADTMMLKVCNDTLDGAGMPFPGVVADYEGEPRDANAPDIGADEFSSASTFDMIDTVGLCTGDTLVLEAFFIDSVVWNGSIISKTLDVTSPATYSVEVFGLCGQATDQIVVLPQDDADLGISNNICFGGATTLNPSVSGGTYNWSTGEATETIIVNAPGNYTVTVTDRFGCPSTATTNVTQSTPVDLPDTVDFCEGGAALLDANMPGAYLWSTNQTSQSISVTTTGTYSVEVTDPFNCITNDTTEVIEILFPIADFGTSTSFLTVTFTNNSQNGTSNMWDFGDGTTSMDSDPVHVFPWPGGTFNVVLTVSNKCGSSSDTLEVSVDEDNTTGIGTLENTLDISMFPNPNNGDFNIAIQGAIQDDHVQLEIVDIQGKLLLNEKIGYNGELMHPVSLTNWSSGIYFVRLVADGKHSIQRITVQ